MPLSLAEVVDSINLKFESGNNIAVEKASITKEEWDVIKQAVLRGRTISERALWLSADDDVDPINSEHDIFKFVEQFVKGPWMARGEPFVLYRDVEQRFVVQVETPASKLALWRHELMADAGVDCATHDSIQFAEQFIDTIGLLLSPHELNDIATAILEANRKWLLRMENSKK